MYIYMYIYIYMGIAYENILYWHIVKFMYIWEYMGIMVPIEYCAPDKLKL